MLVKNSCSIVVLALSVAGIAVAAEVREIAPERTSYIDPVSHLRVWNIAAPPAGNLYYHFSNFTADNRYVIFASARGATSSQIFRYDVETGRIAQLTNEPGIAAEAACPDPRESRRLFYLKAPEVWTMDIVSGEARRIGVIPPPHAGGFVQPTVSHDGRSLALGFQRDAANWEIGLMDIASGSYRTVVRQGFRITHLQHSPTDPMMFYVWETGGYAPQRTWLVNDDGSANRPFYYRTDPKTWFTTLKEWVTHEAWVPQTGDMSMIMDKVGVMVVRKDGTVRVMHRGDYWHAAPSPDGSSLITDDFDGNLWQIETETGNKRLLATGLRGADRATHSHPSFDRQGRRILFNNGRAGRTVSLIDLSELPPFRSAK
jgi:Tol biopolymer transport system component